MISEQFVDCKITSGKCLLVEGPPDRRGEITKNLQAEGWDVSVKWTSDSSFGILAVKLEAKGQ